MNEKVKEDIEIISEKIDTIMKDKTVIALLLLVQGLFYVFSPLGSIEFDLRITLLCLLAYFLKKAYDYKDNITYLIMYGALFVLDIYFLVKTDTIVSIFHIIVGLLLIVIGVYNFYNTTKIKNSNKVTHIISYVLLSSMIIFGILLLFKPLNIGNFIIQIVGLLLIIDAISDLVFIRNNKNKEKLNSNSK